MPARERRAPCASALSDDDNDDDEKMEESEYEYDSGSSSDEDEQRQVARTPLQLDVERVSLLDGVAAAVEPKRPDGSCRVTLELDVRRRLGLGRDRAAALGILSRDTPFSVRISFPRGVYSAGSLYLPVVTAVGQHVTAERMEECGEGAGKPGGASAAAPKMMSAAFLASPEGKPVGS